MSLILDALNRTRQDENAVPGLATHHPLEQLTARRRQFLLWAALAVAGVIIAWLVVDRFRAPSAGEEDIGAPVAELSRNIGSAVNSVTTELKARAAAAEQAQAPAPALAATPPPAPASESPAVIAPEPTASAAQQAIAVAPATGEPTAVQSPAAQVTETPVGGTTDTTAQNMASTEAAVVKPAQGAANAAIAPAPPPAAPVARDAAVDKLYQHRDLEDAPTPRETASPARQRAAADGDAGLPQTVDVDRILEEARDEMENASLEAHPAPFLADLSQRTKDGIPTLYYQRHDYSSDPSQSSVTLNGTAVKTGGSVVPGMKVDEILPDSVVLNYQGTQFRLRALNSWVNL